MKYEVELPTLHPDQEKAWEQYDNNRFTAIRCGRRWGKTDLAKTIAGDAVIHGEPVGWFAPDYKIQSEAFNELADMLDPIKKQSSKVEGVFRAKTGGRIDFWTLENERAGRSRKYKLVVIDEGAFTKPNMRKIWEQSIKPTLLDLGGKALVCSNTNGIDTENFFWRICNESQLPENERSGFVEYHAPTWNNPYVPMRQLEDTDEQHLARRAEVLRLLELNNHPLVFAQEYRADFVDWSGVAFFSRDKMLVDGKGAPEPKLCDAVFAVVDSGTKTGKTNDGTGVVYYARSRHVGHPLVLLDWDLQQIEGALLETWLPTVFQNLEALAKRCGARMGSLGVFIEDKDSGQILLQQAIRRGWRATAIESTLTSAGKDGRAISVSGYVYRGEVKMTQAVFDKITTYKGGTRNHLLAQVVGFRVNDKDAATREDDLLDCFCYGVAIALGNAEGH